MGLLGKSSLLPAQSDSSLMANSEPAYLFDGLINEKSDNCFKSRLPNRSQIPPAQSEFANGLFDRQAKSMFALIGFLKVLAACLERTRLAGSLRWSRKSSRVGNNLLGFGVRLKNDNDGCHARLAHLVRDTKRSKNKR